jgi:hypothetical protein
LLFACSTGKPLDERAVRALATRAADEARV